MKKFIKQKPHEHWAWNDEPKTKSPLAKELEVIGNSRYNDYQIQQASEALEDKYASQYAEYEGDSYGIIDAMKRVMPNSLIRIYDDMHPRLHNEGLTEAVDNKKLNYFVSLGMNAAFEDKKSAIMHLHKTIKELNSLPDTITLYRVLFVNDPKEINKDELGSHYVFNKRDLENSHQQGSHVGGGKPYMVTVKANKQLIDFNETIKNRMEYPHEKELTLLNKGKGVKVIDISPFQTSTDFDDIIGNAEDFDMDFEF